jgi:hypothetical protein
MGEFEYAFKLDGEPVIVKFRRPHYSDIGRLVQKQANRLSEMARLRVEIEDLEKARKDGEDIDVRNYIKKKDLLADLSCDLLYEVAQCRDHIIEPVKLKKDFDRYILNKETSEPLTALIWKFIEDIAMTGEEGKNLSSGQNSKSLPQTSSPAPAQSA